MKAKISSLILFTFLLFLSSSRTNAAEPLFEIKNFNAVYKPVPGKMEMVTVRQGRDVNVFRKQLKQGQQRGLFESVPDPSRPGKMMQRFLPSIWVEVKVREKMGTENVFAKVYIYDERRKVIATLPIQKRYLGGLPAVLDSENTTDLFVPIPQELRNKPWNALVVIGDQYEANAQMMNGSIGGYDYPEKELVAKRGTQAVQRHIVTESVVALEVKTESKIQPIITMFLRAPAGVKDYSEVKGVLCQCVTANNPEEIRKMLLPNDNPLATTNFAFADEHKLAIIAWGSRRVWTGKNYTEQTREEIAQADAIFKDIANGWEKGVKQLCQTYGLPTKNFLLWGSSGSGHWAGRLALRKPEYFLAVHVHISQHFDAPRPEANRIMWLLTAGEADTGYADNVRFFQEGKRMGYPIIHKGLEGVAHARSVLMENLGAQFFAYALSKNAEREAYDRTYRPIASKGPWLEDFRSPPFYGDTINQICVPAEQVDTIPEGFRVPLPTKEIADTWNYKPKPTEQVAAEMRPPNIGKNLARNKPFVCSAPSLTKHQRDGLTDGFWRFQFLTDNSPVFPKTITIDLQKESSVGWVLLGVPDYSIVKTLTISLSVDGRNFTEVDSHEFSKGFEALHLYNFTPTPARYVRLTFPDHYGSYGGMAITEVEVYGPKEENANEKRLR